MNQWSDDMPRAGRRSPFRTAIVVVTIGILAGLSAWSLFSATRWRKERDDAERARAEAVERLEKVESAVRERAEEVYKLHVAQARAGRLTAQAGRRFAGLEAVRRASEAADPTGLSPAKVLELRNVAIACLALTDLRWKADTEPRAENDHGGHALDATLERCSHVDGEGVVEVRRVSGNEVLRRLPPPDGLEVASVHAAFTPDGNMIALLYSGDENAGRLRVWDLDKQKVILEMASGGGMDLSADGRALAACGVDGAIGIFRLPDASEARRIGTGGNAACISLDAPGMRLAMSGEKGIAVFDVEGGRETVTLRQETPVLALAWSHEGRWLAAGGADRRIYIHDVTGRTRSRVMEGHDETVASFVWSPTDDLLASSGQDGTTRIWDTRSGDLSSAIPTGAVRFHRDGKSLGTVTDAHVFGIWEVARPAVLSTLGQGRTASASPWSSRESVHDVAFSPDGRWLACAGTEGVRIWNPGTAREAADVPIGFVESVCFDPRTGALITFGEFGLIRWPFTAGEGEGAPWTLGPPEILDPSGKRGPQRVAFDRERHLACTGLAEAQAIIFDAVDPSKRTTLPIGPDITTFSLSPDGRWAVAARSRAPRATVWDMKTGVSRSLAVAGASPTDGLLSAAFSPDGAWLAIGWTRGISVARVGGAWERRLEIKRGRREQGTCPVAFHPAGSTLAVARDPKAVLLVDFLEDRELATLTAPVPRVISWLAFSPTGDFLAAAAEDGVVQLWDLRALREGLGVLRLDGQPTLPGAAGAGEAERPAATEIAVVDGELPGKRFRELRLATLEADLASWTWDLAGSDGETRSRVLEKLTDPLGDPVLRGTKESLRAKTLPGADQGTWEAFVARVRALQAELSADAGPPKTPLNRRPQPGAAVESSPVLESSPFQGATPGAAHGWSRWQVRTVGGSFNVSPAIDILSTSALTSLKLPRGLLLPRTTCFWRVAHAGADGRISEWSSDTPFTTASSRMRLERIDLTAVFNRDVVADPGDSKNDAFDPGPPPPLLTIHGFDGERAENREARGLPHDRLVGDHLLGDYRGLNSIQLAPGDRKPVRIQIPKARYAALRFLVAGGWGDSKIPLKLEYVGGAVESASLPCDDWTKDLPLSRSDRLRSGATAVWKKMDHIRDRKLVNDDAAALFEVILRVNDGEDLSAVVLSPSEGEFHRDVTRFNLLAVTAMTAE